MTELAVVDYTMSAPALDDAHVYWAGILTTQFTTGTAGPMSNGGLVASVLKTGGTPVTLLQTTYAPGPPTVDGASLYWGELLDYSTGGGVVRSVATSGGTEVDWNVDASNHPGRFAADATTLYFTTIEGAVMSMPKGGGVAVTLAADEKPIQAILVDETSIYWSRSEQGNGIPGGLKKLSKAGGVPVALTSSAGLLAQDDSTIYYTGTDTLMKVPKAGGAPVTLLSGIAPYGIAVDGTSVYYLDSFSASLRKIPKSGGAPTELVHAPKVGEMSVITSLAVDATSVYWVRTEYADIHSKSHLMKMPK